MIAHFLRHEYARPERYGDALRASLEAEQVDEALLIHPDLSCERDNAARRRVFARFRGYGTGQPSFLTDFPDSGVDWQWIALTPVEVLDTRYIRYVEWAELSAGTRSPRVAAARSHAGEVDGARFAPLVAILREGGTLPAPILVTTDTVTTPVILEGHTRITAYALAPDCIPDEVTALLGISPEIAHWDEF